MSQQPVLRFGLIGLGGGGRSLLRAFREHPAIRLTAAADVRPEALDEFSREYGADTFLSAEELCRSPNVDAVWVATPNHLHAEHAIIAAEHHKHVIVSKPMAVTIDECQEMIAACEKHGVRLLVGHTQSLLPGIRKMAELVRSGSFGRLGMVHSWHFTPWIYRPRMPEELDLAKGGGVVYRQAPHQIDIVRFIGGGQVRSVRAMTGMWDAARPVPGAFVTYLEFQDGTPATIVYSGYGHFDASELTFGLGGFLSGRGRVLVPSGLPAAAEEMLKQSERDTASATNKPQSPASGTKDVPSVPFGLTIASCARADLRQSPSGITVYGHQGQRREIPVPGPEPRGWPELQDLYDAVMYGKPIVHDGHWGLATQEVVTAIMRSAEERREVFLAHQAAVAI